LALLLSSSNFAGSLRRDEMRIEIFKKCDQRKHFLLNRIANAWNKLPGEIAHAPSVNRFDKKMQKRIKFDIILLYSIVI
jgi:hypothetical protein